MVFIFTMICNVSFILYGKDTVEYFEIAPSLDFNLYVTEKSLK